MQFFLSSATCDEKLPKARELAGQGKLNEALDMLMALEKQTRFFYIFLDDLMCEPGCRSGADTHSTARVLVTIVQLSFEAGDWAGMEFCE